jgi:hypothetical protein
MIESAGHLALLEDSLVSRNQALMIGGRPDLVKNRGAKDYTKNPTMFLEDG